MSGMLYFRPVYFYTWESCIPEFENSRSLSPSSIYFLALSFFRLRYMLSGKPGYRFRIIGCETRTESETAPDSVITYWPGYHAGVALCSFRGGVRKTRRPLLTASLRSSGPYANGKDGHPRGGGWRGTSPRERRGAGRESHFLNDCSALFPGKKDRELGYYEN